MRLSRTVVAVVLVVALQAAAEQPVPMGTVAASVADEVVLVDPAAGSVARFAAGPVGFLFPAPGGLLFAPDLVDNHTTVLDLRTGRVAERLEGVTLPRFGGQSDRYLVVAGDVLVFSYPDRAPMFRVEAGVASPWQVLMTPDDMMVLVLDRLPGGVGPATLVAVDLIDRRVVQRAILPGDVARMALSAQLGMLALAARDAASVLLVEPATLATVLELPVDGHPVDVAFSPGGRHVATLANGVDRSRLVLVELKTGRREIKLKQHLSLDLPAPAVRMELEPAGRFAAVGLESGRLVVVDLEDGTVVHDLELGAAPRDLAWCDPAREGPLMPEWSDQRPTPATRDLRRPERRTPGG